MTPEQIHNILTSIDLPLDDPQFLPTIFAAVVGQGKKGEDKVKRILDEEYLKLSIQVDRSGIQESCSVRNVLRSRALASTLINEKGELESALLPIAIEHLKATLYSLGPNRHYDAKRQQQILSVLLILSNNQEVVRLLKKIYKPFGNKHLESLIRDTLDLPHSTIITDMHTRQAVLAAWFCCLRQNVGSCFATAPAEIIHDEQPEQFLLDMSELLSTGRLKRVIHGVEYAVPMSPSWGNGDLKKPLVVYRVSGVSASEPWRSPAMILALESVGILHKEQPFKAKSGALRNLIMPLIARKARDSAYAIVTTEEILRDILLHAASLSEKQIDEFENRPRIMANALSLFTAPAKPDSVSAKCSRFFEQYEITSKIFRGFADNALLKAWEFTLASFAETKLEFTTWNLYASLGFNTSDPGGIGGCIYRIIQEKLDLANRKVEELQRSYEAAFYQLKTTESLLMHATTEKEMEWKRVEYRTAKSECDLAEEVRSRAQNAARSLVALHQSLHDVYIELFQNYFQEVYDADMQDVATGPFDDSPAGFRLLYKHGRSQTSLWTQVKNQHDFIEALCSFFSATESQLMELLDVEGMERDLSDIVTAIITHIRTREFLESAFNRTAAIHQKAPIKNPLENLDKIKTKPWVYVSGGNMHSLLQSYYRRETPLSEVSKWFESETELLMFLIDSVKEIPPQFMKSFAAQRRNALLMQSPTHAFLLKPNYSSFKEVCSKEGFTYTMVRDRYITPAKRFIETLYLDDEMLHFFLSQLFANVPEYYQRRLNELFRFIRGPMNPLFLRRYILDALAQDRSQRLLSVDEIDSFLYSALPLCPASELQMRCQQILQQLHFPSINHFEPFLRSLHNSFVTADRLQQICQAIICLNQGQGSTAEDYPLLISQAARKLGFAMPAPILFADTNWVKDEFALLVNPGTGELELWRMDYIGRNGSPMSIWKKWVDGSHDHPKWVIYNKPAEYGQL